MQGVGGKIGQLQKLSNYLKKLEKKKIVVEGKFGPSGGKVTDAS